jgi:hypothetical protein
MRRIDRDYCSKNYHPRWKLWSAKYLDDDKAPKTYDIGPAPYFAQSFTVHRWQGNFCGNCGAEVSASCVAYSQEHTTSMRPVTFKSGVRTIITHKPKLP